MASLNLNRKDPIELEHLLGSYGSPDHEHDEDGDEYLTSFDPEGLDRTFYTQPPQTRLQNSLGWVAVKCARGASQLATHHTTRRIPKRILLFLCLQCIAVFLFLFVAITPVVFPSYANPPEHYNELRRRTMEVTSPGSANINNEKVFIAASIYDAGGLLAGGAWGQALAMLVHILGPDNVFLSIYEDNADASAKGALAHLSQHVTCNQSMITEDFDISSIPQVILPDERYATKRIAFLAEVRNRALRPLEDPKSDAFETTFDKLLYLNDVIFDPVDAANLLLSTNVDGHGRTQYRAACALDFINPFKYYDTFATRDLEGDRLGVPIYPWFSNAGEAQSRADVLEQRDAVRVRSCWGGMVAFEAKWFQGHGSKAPKLTPGINPDTPHTNSSASASQESVPSNSSETSPLRFRAENEVFWDASECCLIHADLQSLEPMDSVSNSDPSKGIYMNPYVRVAYDISTHHWIPFAQRFERILSPIQSILTYLAIRPSDNPRRLEEGGQQVTNRIWVPDVWRGPPGGNHTYGGHYETVNRTALPGGFCGSKKLLLIATNEAEQEQSGRWWSEKVPLDLGT